MEVARELRDEKKKLWKIEDALNEAKIETSGLKKVVAEKRRENEQLVADLGEERQLRLATEHTVETLGRELRILKAAAAKMRDDSESAASEVQSGEDALQEAFEQMYDEKRRRQMAEEKMDHVTQQILAIPGGGEILKQLLQGGAAGIMLSASPSPLSPHMPVTNL